MIAAMKSLHYKKGEICNADDGSAAYKIKSGSADVFLVPYKAETAGRRVMIHEAHEKETVPGFDFTDKEHSRWVFCFRATEDLELIVTEGGATNVLKKKFAERAGLQNLEEEGFEYAAIERYNEQKIREDLNISKKEEETALAAAEKERTIEEMAAAKARAAEAETVGTGGSGAHIGAALSFARVRSGRADRIWITLLSAAAAVCGALMFFAASETAFVICALVFLALIVLKNRRISRTALASGTDSQQEAFRTLFKLDEETYRKYGKTELAALCMNVYGMAKQIVHSSLGMCSGAVVCAAMFAGAIAAGPKAGMLFTAIALAAGGAIAACIDFASRYSMQAARGREKANTRLYHYLRNMNKIKVSGSEENILRDYFNLRAAKAASRLRAIHLLGAADAVQVLIPAAVIPAAVLAPDLRAWILPLAVLGGCWLQTVRQISEMPQLAADAERIRIVLDEKGDEPAESIEMVSSIELENVRFSYGSKEVLKGMSMHIEKGETIGLIGASGSGKTTLLKLITGIEKPSGGTIRVNGRNIGEIDISSYRKRIAVAAQDDALIAGSLIDNIRMGSGASAEEVYDAIVKADLAGFVSELPMGVDTLLSEESGNISYGQKQKILIARALVRKPDLIILDEAMSEMDNESIEKICYALNELNAAKIIVSHRVEPLKYCDRMVVTESENQCIDI